ncbi:alcohol dehydrogenase catalytic domain-containing protein [Rhodococcus tibetensis]|uniref:Zinc-binding dehydrogenase n=1 Tax=Rhodococcus tibetensis TaxID=2965064 RepID=A0ABT1QJ60_9NOCA|nr:zinc-binding dehydrogenase [Rhodococcus sp. FXJ9.536]MCQ4122333.1 zinc-binding dehydrogenase [Rhodococcus sp. FXJ9.536]
MSIVAVRTTRRIGGGDGAPVAPGTTPHKEGSTIARTMRAVVLTEPGPVEKLQIRELPVPEPRPGSVRIAVKAFGLNRSDYHMRMGLAEGVRYPIVPGLEAVGVVDAAPGSDLRPGQQVAALMGGMGRAYNGGYAEYTVVPRSSVVPFRSCLPWDVLGAVPETLQTAYGSLTTGLDLKSGQTLLIRGGTSALGFATAALAHDLGATVLATTRQPDRLDNLETHAVDHPILDNGAIANQVHRIKPGGVDAALELVGTPTLPDTLVSTRIHGTVCFAGMLSDQWTVRDFYPIAYIPRGVRLTSYSGGSADLPAPVLQRYLDRISDGAFGLGPLRTYSMDQIRDAHHAVATNSISGKIVVLTPSGLKEAGEAAMTEEPLPRTSQ